MDYELETVVLKALFNQNRACEFSELRKLVRLDYDELQGTFQSLLRVLPDYVYLDRSSKEIEYWKMGITAFHFDDVEKILKAGGIDIFKHLQSKAEAEEQVRRSLEVESLKSNIEFAKKSLEIATHANEI